MCQIKLAACLSVFQCKSSIVSYRVVFPNVARCVDQRVWYNVWPMLC